MPALTIWTSRFNWIEGSVGDVQFASERKSYSSLTVQCDLKPYSRPAPTSQPELVFDPLQLTPGKSKLALLWTQPPPAFAYISQRSSTRPTRPATVPIQFWLTEPSVGVGKAGWLKIAPSKSPSTPSKRWPAWKL